METFITRFRVIGDLVLAVTCGRKAGHRELIKACVLLGILSHLAALEAPKKFCVLLECQAVCRDMFGSQADGLFHSPLPCLDGLPRHSKNQIEVQMRESRLPRDVK